MLFDEAGFALSAAFDASQNPGESFLMVVLLGNEIKER
jgi:hypothetical protein